MNSETNKWPDNKRVPKKTNLNIIKTSRKENLIERIVKHEAQKRQRQNEVKIPMSVQERDFTSCEPLNQNSSLREAEDNEEMRNIAESKKKLLKRLEANSILEKIKREVITKHLNIIGAESRKRSPTTRDLNINRPQSIQNMMEQEVSSRVIPISPGDAFLRNLSKSPEINNSLYSVSTNNNPNQSYNITSIRLPNKEEKDLQKLKVNTSKYVPFQYHADSYNNFEQSNYGTNKFKAISQDHFYKTNSERVFGKVNPNPQNFMTNTKHDNKARTRVKFQLDSSHNNVNDKIRRPGDANSRYDITRQVSTLKEISSEEDSKEFELITHANPSKYAKDTVVVSGRDSNNNTFILGDADNTRYERKKVLYEIYGNFSNRLSDFLLRKPRQKSRKSSAAQPEPEIKDINEKIKINQKRNKFNEDVSAKITQQRNIFKEQRSPDASISVAPYNKSLLSINISNISKESSDNKIKKNFRGGIIPFNGSPIPNDRKEILLAKKFNRHDVLKVPQRVRENAAKFIQVVWREHSKINRLAATKIQSLWRGVKLRIKVRSVIYDYFNLQNMIINLQRLMTLKYFNILISQLSFVAEIDEFKKKRILRSAILIQRTFRKFNRLKRIAKHKPELFFSRQSTLTIMKTDRDIPSEPSVVPSDIPSPQIIRLRPINTISPLIYSAGFSKIYKTNEVYNKISSIQKHFRCRAEIKRTYENSNSASTPNVECRRVIAPMNFTKKCLDVFETLMKVVRLQRKWKQNKLKHDILNKLNKETQSYTFKKLKMDTFFTKEYKFLSSQIVNECEQNEKKEEKKEEEEEGNLLEGRFKSEPQQFKENEYKKPLRFKNCRAIPGMTKNYKTYEIKTIFRIQKLIRILLNKKRDFIKNTPKENIDNTEKIEDEKPSTLQRKPIPIRIFKYSISVSMTKEYKNLHKPILHQISERENTEDTVLIESKPVEFNKTSLNENKEKFSDKNIQEKEYIYLRENTFNFNICAKENVIKPTEKIQRVAENVTYTTIDNTQLNTTLNTNNNSILEIPKDESRFEIIFPKIFSITNLESFSYSKVVLEECLKLKETTNQLDLPSKFPIKMFNFKPIKSQSLITKSIRIYDRTTGDKNRMDELPISFSVIKLDPIEFSQNLTSVLPNHVVTNYKNFDRNNVAYESLEPEIKDHIKNRQNLRPFYMTKSYRLKEEFKNNLDSSSKIEKVESDAINLRGIYQEKFEIIRKTFTFEKLPDNLSFIQKHGESEKINEPVFKLKKLQNTFFSKTIKPKEIPNNQVKNILLEFPKFHSEDLQVESRNIEIENSKVINIEKTNLEFSIINVQDNKPKSKIIFKRLLVIPGFTKVIKAREISNVKIEACVQEKEKSPLTNLENKQVNAFTTLELSSQDFSIERNQDHKQIEEKPVTNFLPLILDQSNLEFSILNEEPKIFKLTEEANNINLEIKEINQINFKGEKSIQNLPELKKNDFDLQLFSSINFSIFKNDFSYIENVLANKNILLPFKLKKLEKTVEITKHIKIKEISNTVNSPKDTKETVEISQNNEINSEQLEKKDAKVNNYVQLSEGFSILKVEVDINDTNYNDKSSRIIRRLNKISTFTKIIKTNEIGHSLLKSHEYEAKKDVIPSSKSVEEVDDIKPHIKETSKAFVFKKVSNNVTITKKNLTSKIKKIKEIQRFFKIKSGKVIKDDKIAVTPNIVSLTNKTSDEIIKIEDDTKLWLNFAITNEYDYSFGNKSDIPSTENKIKEEALNPLTETIVVPKQIEPEILPRIIHKIKNPSFTFSTKENHKPNHKEVTKIQKNWKNHQIKNYSNKLAINDPEIFVDSSKPRSDLSVNPSEQDEESNLLLSLIYKKSSLPNDLNKQSKDAIEKLVKHILSKKRAKNTTTNDIQLTINSINNYKNSPSENEIIQRSKKFFKIQNYSYATKINIIRNLKDLTDSNTIDSTNVMNITHQNELTIPVRSKKPAPIKQLVLPRISSFAYLIKESKHSNVKEVEKIQRKLRYNNNINKEKEIPQSKSAIVDNQINNPLEVEREQKPTITQNKNPPSSEITKDIRNSLITKMLEIRRKQRQQNEKKTTTDSVEQFIREALINTPVSFNKNKANVYNTKTNIISFEKQIKLIQKKWRGSKSSIDDFSMEPLVEVLKGVNNDDDSEKDSNLLSFTNIDDLSKDSPKSKAKRYIRYVIRRINKIRKGIDKLEHTAKIAKPVLTLEESKQIPILIKKIFIPCSITKEIDHCTHKSINNIQKNWRQHSHRSLRKNSVEVARKASGKLSRYKYSIEHSDNNIHFSIPFLIKRLECSKMISKDITYVKMKYIMMIQRLYRKLQKKRKNKLRGYKYSIEHSNNNIHFSLPLIIKNREYFKTITKQTKPHYMKYIFLIQKLFRNLHKKTERIQSKGEVKEISDLPINLKSEDNIQNKEVDKKDEPVPVSEGKIQGRTIVIKKLYNNLFFNKETKAKITTKYKLIQNIWKRRQQLPVRKISSSPKNNLNYLINIENSSNMEINYQQPSKPLDNVFKESVLNSYINNNERVVDLPLKQRKIFSLKYLTKSNKFPVEKKIEEVQHTWKQHRSNKKVIKPIAIKQQKQELVMEEIRSIEVASRKVIADQSDSKLIKEIPKIIKFTRCDVLSSFTKAFKFINLKNFIKIQREIKKHKNVVPTNPPQDIKEKLQEDSINKEQELLLSLGIKIPKLLPVTITKLIRLKEIINEQNYIDQSFNLELTSQHNEQIAYLGQKQRAYLLEKDSEYSAREKDLTENKISLDEEKIKKIKKIYNVPSITKHSYNTNYKNIIEIQRKYRKSKLNGQTSKPAPLQITKSSEFQSIHYDIPLKPLKISLYDLPLAVNKKEKSDKIIQSSPLLEKAPLLKLKTTPMLFTKSFKHTTNSQILEIQRTWRKSAGDGNKPFKQGDLIFALVSNQLEYKSPNIKIIKPAVDISESNNVEKKFDIVREFAEIKLVPNKQISIDFAPEVKAEKNQIDQIHPKEKTSINDIKKDKEPLQLVTNTPICLDLKSEGINKPEPLQLITNPQMNLDYQVIRSSPLALKQRKIFSLNYLTKNNKFQVEKKIEDVQHTWKQHKSNKKVIKQIAIKQQYDLELSRNSAIEVGTVKTDDKKIPAISRKLLNSIVNMTKKTRSISLEKRIVDLQKGYKKYKESKLDKNIKLHSVNYDENLKKVEKDITSQYNTPNKREIILDEYDKPEENDEIFKEIIRSSPVRSIQNNEKEDIETPQTYQPLKEIPNSNESRLKSPGTYTNNYTIINKYNYQIIKSSQDIIHKLPIVKPCLFTKEAKSRLSGKISLIQRRLSDFLKDKTVIKPEIENLRKKILTNIFMNKNNFLIIFKLKNLRKWRNIVELLKENPVDEDEIKRNIAQEKIVNLEDKEKVYEVPENTIDSSEIDCKDEDKERKVLVYNPDLNSPDHKKEEDPPVLIKVDELGNSPVLKAQEFSFNVNSKPKEETKRLTEVLSKIIMRVNIREMRNYQLNHMVRKNIFHSN